MKESEIEDILREFLRDIAPEAELGALGREDDIRDALELDSMDFLNFVTAIDERLHVPVPESDYREIGSLAACVAYLVDRGISLGGAAEEDGDRSSRGE